MCVTISFTFRIDFESFVFMHAHKNTPKNTTNPNNAHLHTKFDSVFVLSDHGIGTIFKKQLEQTISTTIL